MNKEFKNKLVDFLVIKSKRQDLEYGLFQLLYHRYLNHLFYTSIKEVMSKSHISSKLRLGLSERLIGRIKSEVQNDSLKTQLF